MDALRSLPPVDALAAQADAPRALAVAAARAVLAERRRGRLGGRGAGPGPPGRGRAGGRARARAAPGRGAAPARAWAAEGGGPSRRRVVTATGVFVHTTLGRAPLALAGREGVTGGAAGYATLELDLETGARGSRHAHVEGLLRELTGAEAA